MITAFLQHIAALLRQELAAASRPPELAELPVLVAFHDPAPSGDHLALEASSADPLIEGQHIYRLEGQLSIVVQARSRTAEAARALLADAGQAALQVLCFGWSERYLPAVSCHVYALEPALEPLSANGAAYEQRLSFTATLQFFAPPAAG